MRFEEVYGVWTEGLLSQEEAARILGVCATFRRYIDRSRHASGAPRTGRAKLRSSAPLFGILIVMRRMD